MEVFPIISCPNYSGQGLNVGASSCQTCILLLSHGSSVLVKIFFSHNYVKNQPSVRHLIWGPIELDSLLQSFWNLAVLGGRGDIPAATQNICNSISNHLPCSPLNTLWNFATDYNGQQSIKAKIFKDVWDSWIYWEYWCWYSEIFGYAKSIQPQISQIQIILNFCTRQQKTSTHFCLWFCILCSIPLFIMYLIVCVHIVACIANRFYTLLHRLFNVLYIPPICTFSLSEKGELR